MSSSNIDITTSQGNVVLDKSLVLGGRIPIYDCTGLQAMQSNLSGSYVLMNDIDCTYCTQDPGGACYNGGAGFAPVGTFSGILDGHGHTITGLKINRGDNVGLFGSINNATIKNIGMINADITGSNFAGCLIGYCSQGASTITNCYSTGSVSVSHHYIGGLIGYMYGGTTVITDCYCTCSVSIGVASGGGLIGLIGNFTVTNCYSTGLVSGPGADIGGLIGWTTGGTTTNSFWDTETSGQASSDGGTGKTTAEMKQQATFTNWDFATIWDIIESTTYPQLRPFDCSSEEFEYYSNGYIRINHDSGADYTDWIYYGLLTTQPDNTNVKLRCRSALTESGLSSASWGSYVETTSGSLGCLNNRWIEVEIYSETSDTSVTPAVHKLILEYKK